MTDSLKVIRRIPRLKRALGVVAAVAFVGDAIALLAWRAGRLDAVDLSTVMILCSVVGVAAVGMALTYTPGAIPDTGSMTGWDHLQKNRIWHLLGNVIAGLLWTGMGTRWATQAFGEGDRLAGYGYAALVLLYLYLAPAALMGWGAKPAHPDDELSRAFRARATASGFWALLAGGACAFLISFTAPTILPALLPFVLWLGGAVACAHFVWLHYRAEQDLDDDG